jgi:hypothetical protein
MKAPEALRSVMVPWTASSAPAALKPIRKMLPLLA